MEDIVSLEEKLGRSLSKQERSRIGVSKLRFFLEELLQRRYAFICLMCVCVFSILLKLFLPLWFIVNLIYFVNNIFGKFMHARYMDSVPLIIPLLEKEYCSTARKLNEINRELRFGTQTVFFFLFFFIFF